MCWPMLADELKICAERGTADVGSARSIGRVRLLEVSVIDYGGNMAMPDNALKPLTKQKLLSPIGRNRATLFV